jgi:hypothetical protein
VVMTEGEIKDLEKAVKKLGREIVGIIPEVWEVSLGSRSREKQQLVILINCTREAEIRVLQNMLTVVTEAISFTFAFSPKVLDLGREILNLLGGGWSKGPPFFVPRKPS